MAALGVQAQRLGAGDEDRGVPGRRRRVVTLLGAYAAVATLGAGLSLWLGHDPVAFEGAWLGTSGPAAVLVSLGLGVCIGSTTVVVSRVMVRRSAWARSLHAALRPAVHGAGDASLLAIAIASAAGEELLFRGLLVPLLGVVVSSLAFGALHQIRGPARWGWMAWATVMGFVFGGVFVATGSLAGPVVAHAIINAANLRFLRDNDPAPRARALGGLLRRG
ncbi:MAG TPA: CPBP family intramembrane glutamic endopeptidase [Polyangiaceae bacterium]